MRWLRLNLESLFDGETIMNKLSKCLYESFRCLRSRLYWQGRSVKARVHCWYISKIWLPLHQTQEMSEAERQEAVALINDILEEIRAEEDVENVRK